MLSLLCFLSVSPSSMLSSGSNTTRTRTSGTSITANTAATLDRAAKVHLLVPSSLALHLYLHHPPVS